MVDCYVCGRGFIPVHLLLYIYNLSFIYLTALYNFYAASVVSEASLHKA